MIKLAKGAVSEIETVKERVRLMMKHFGIQARGKRKFVVTTESKHNLPIAPNLLQRNFTTTAPNQVWTGLVEKSEID